MRNLNKILTEKAGGQGDEIIHRELLGALLEDGVGEVTVCRKQRAQGVPQGLAPLPERGLHHLPEKLLRDGSGSSGCDCSPKILLAVLSCYGPGSSG